MPRELWPVDMMPDRLCRKQSPVAAVALCPNNCTRCCPGGQIRPTFAGGKACVTMLDRRFVARELLDVTIRSNSFVASMEHSGGTNRRQKPTVELVFWTNKSNI